MRENRDSMRCVVAINVEDVKSDDCIISCAKSCCPRMIFNQIGAAAEKDLASGGIVSKYTVEECILLRVSERDIRARNFLLTDMIKQRLTEGGVTAQVGLLHEMPFTEELKLKEEFREGVEKAEAIWETQKGKVKEI